MSIEASAARAEIADARSVLARAFMGHGAVDAHVPVCRIVNSKELLIFTASKEKRRGEGGGRGIVAESFDSV